ncbi:MAG: ATP-dependent RNA helicase HrpA [Ilumatobacteraceae bacterium]
MIVAGETGSGKSTQLPKLCLELGRGTNGKRIGHTQPRRVAARTIAERVAEELGEQLGGTVGYQVRFTDRVGADTRVKVMTDGILLAEIQRDRELSRYDTLIIDEAHERSLNIDFLLGYLRQLLPRRPDLSVVITSATIDTETFSAHFADAPIIEVSGRTYPVEVRYRPFGVEPDDDRDQVQAILDACDELRDEAPGDVLVFLSGEREIHDTADALRREHERRNDATTEVLPLYARLSAAEQHRIFEPHRGRRIVLSTNVAETSLTVPGVRYVVDTGTARISRYSTRLKVQRLPIEPVSQASANQRAGRCGRVAPGVCIRLYAEEDFDARPEFTDPEILRTNLASVILQMLAIGLGDIAGFPFVEPPEHRSINDGLQLLDELRAVRTDQRGDRRLTRLGRRLAQLPLDPRLGRMVLEAERRGCVREVMIITAAMSIQDPRERPADHEQHANELHRRFHGEDGSDFMTLVRLWDYLREQQKQLSGNQFRKLCRNEYLNYLRVREWQDLYSQLRRVVGQLDIRLNHEHAHPDHVHQALLSGLLSQLGMRRDDSRDFTGSRNTSFVIAPGSVLTKKPPKWVMAGELVETNRLWARRCARIQPQWIEPLAGDLAKRTYGEPWWDAERGHALVVERVLLYGLPIIAGRQIPLSRLDEPLAREIFLRNALVEGDWSGSYPFQADNAAVVDEVRALESRFRRRDLMVDDETILRFYDRRVPADVTSARDFDRWWRRVKTDRPDVLSMTVDTLLDVDEELLDHDAFPETWTQGELELPISYQFEPGSPDDGATVHIALPLLNQVTDDGFDWLVPGLRTELLAALVRSLPKPLRKHVVPVSDTVTALRSEIGPGDGPLLDVVARALGRRSGERISATDFDLTRVPDHLRVTFAVEDHDGGRVAYSKDLAVLKEQLLPRARVAIARAAAESHGIERRGITEWEFGELPELIESERNGHAVRGYPALVDDGDSVSIRVLTNERTQEVSMRAGTRRLLLLNVPASRKVVARPFGNDVALALAALELGKAADLADQCVVAAVDELMRRHGGPVRDAVAFDRLREAVGPTCWTWPRSWPRPPARSSWSRHGWHGGSTSSGSTPPSPRPVTPRPTCDASYARTSSSSPVPTGCETCCGTCAASSVGWRRCPRSHAGPGEAGAGPAFGGRVLLHPRIAPARRAIPTPRSTSDGSWRVPGSPVRPEPRDQRVDQ